MLNGVDEAIVKVIAGIVGLLIICVPLAVWKMVDIIVWIYHHIHFGVSP